MSRKTNKRRIVPSTPAAGSTVSTAGETVERKRKNRKRNPFRSLIRSMVAEHSMKVGRGFLADTATVDKEISLADGSIYSVTVKRVTAATMDVDPFTFPKRAKAVTEIAVDVDDEADEDMDDESEAA